MAVLSAAPARPTKKMTPARLSPVPGPVETTTYHTRAARCRKSSAALIQKGCAYVRKGNNKL
jgi:hypothetical protein